MESFLDGFYDAPAVGGVALGYWMLAGRWYYGEDSTVLAMAKQCFVTKVTGNGSVNGSRGMQLFVRFEVKWAGFLLLNVDTGQKDRRR